MLPEATPRAECAAELFGQARDIGGGGGGGGGGGAAAAEKGKEQRNRGAEGGKEPSFLGVCFGKKETEYSFFLGTGPTDGQGVSPKQRRSQRMM